MFKGRSDYKMIVRQEKQLKAMLAYLRVFRKTSYRQSNLIFFGAGTLAPSYKIEKRVIIRTKITSHLRRIAQASIL